MFADVICTVMPAVHRGYISAYRNSLIADQGRAVTTQSHHDTNSVWRVAW